MDARKDFTVLRNANVLPGKCKDTERYAKTYTWKLVCHHLSLWYNLINITFNIDVRDDIRVREYAHITLLAMAEVSRHMSNLRRIAAVEFPYRDFNDLYFAVSFATNPPTLKLETTQMIKKKKKYKHVVEDLLRRVGSYDPSRVALLRIEPLMDLWPDYVDSMYRLVELDKTGSDNSRLTAILEAGKVMGGTRREPCSIGLDKETLEAEYDIIDEIVRRTNEKMAGRPLLCDFRYAAAIEKEVKVLLVELEGSDRKVIYI